MIPNIRSLGDKYKELSVDNFLKILDKTIEKRFPL